MTTETKAGLMTAFFLAAVIGAIIFLSGGLPFLQRWYEIRMRVANAGGMQVGVPVQMAGIQIGEVAGLGLTRFGQAEIVLRIREQYKIPQGSRFAIGTQGLLGTRFVTISPGPPDNPPMPPGSVIAGEDPFTLEQIADRIGNVARRAEEALINLNRLIGDPDLGRNLSETARNAKETTAIMRQVAEEVRGVVGNVERTTRALDRTVSADVPLIATQLKQMSEDLAGAAQEVRTLARDINADGETAKQVRETIGAIQRTTQRIEKMATDLSGLINEREVRSVRASIGEAQTAITEARQAVGEARALIGRADQVVQRVNKLVPERLDLPDFRTSYRLEYQLWYGRRIGHDVMFTLLPEGARRYIFGLRDIGQTNRVNLQVASRLPDPALVVRYGLIDSQVGVGLDWRPSDSWLYAAELYNLNNVTMNFYTHYFLQPEHGIALRVHGLFVTPTVGIGYFRRF